MDFGNNTFNKPPAPMGEKSNVVNLSKGQKVSLSKVAPSLTKMMVGLGWDTNKYDGGEEFDLDASVFMCGPNDKCEPDNFIFYNNLKSANGCVEHQGDNRTGEGDGDDEKIMIDLTLVPSNIEKLAITVTINLADVRKQNFGLVSNAFIRLVDMNTEQEVLRYDLSEDFSVETAIVVAEIYRHNGEWKFNAIGSGFAGGLMALCKNYGIEATM